MSSMNTNQTEIQQRNQAHVARRATIDTMKLTTFGKRLMLARKDIGLTQEELIDALARYNVSIGQTYVSALETTDKMPVGQVVAAMAKVLGVSADYLLLLTDDPLPQSAANDAHAVGISREAEELARIVDRLPPFRRGEILAHAQMVERMEADNERDVAAALGTVVTQLRSAGLVVGEKTLAELVAIFRDYTAALLGADAVGAFDALAAGRKSSGSRRKPHG
jgi:transcriptional regulator with XRE-family HTH domain